MHLPYFRRMWRVYSKLAPSLNLSPYTDSFASDYPFSVPVDKKVSVEDLMALVRDHYEGTEFDNTKVRERERERGYMRYGRLPNKILPPIRYDAFAAPAYSWLCVSYICCCVHNLIAFCLAFRCHCIGEGGNAIWRPRSVQYLTHSYLLFHLLANVYVYYYFGFLFIIILLFTY